MYKGGILMMMVAYQISFLKRIATSLALYDN